MQTRRFLIHSGSVSLNDIILTNKWSFQIIFCINPQRFIMKHYMIFSLISIVWLSLLPVGVVPWRSICPSPNIFIINLEKFVKISFDFKSPNFVTFPKNDAQNLQSTQRLLPHLHELTPVGYLNSGYQNEGFFTSLDWYSTTFANWSSNRFL